MERITRRRTEEKKIKEETITINMEQLEELWKDNEYAKEWKASKYNELLEENKRTERTGKTDEKSEKRSKVQ